MSAQLDLFAWADARPSNVIDIMPALIRKAEIETACRVVRAPLDARVIQLGKTA